MTDHSGCPEASWSESAGCYVCWEHEGDLDVPTPVLCSCGRNSVGMGYSPRRYYCGSTRCLIDECRTAMSEFMLKHEAGTEVLEEALDLIRVEGVLES